MSKFRKYDIISYTNIQIFSRLERIKEKAAPTCLHYSGYLCGCVHQLVPSIYQARPVLADPGRVTPSKNTRRLLET
uniref:Uncharacterized protein n=1 Tax=Heterorhabditis bacteriophora TaxID=37862 RepID=A0A1I7WP33_HETBA